MFFLKPIPWNTRQGLRTSTGTHTAKAHLRGAEKNVPSTAIGSTAGHRGQGSHLPHLCQRVSSQCRPCPRAQSHGSTRARTLRGHTLPHAWSLRLNPGALSPPPHVPLTPLFLPTETCGSNSTPCTCCLWCVLTGSCLSFPLHLPMFCRPSGPFEDQHSPRGQGTGPPPEWLACPGEDAPPHTHRPPRDVPRRRGDWPLWGLPCPGRGSSA